MAADGTFVIKRIKKGGGEGHHGGAWKVAYADFVTAMMAFFLVMWLVAQSKSVKAGVAEASKTIRHMDWFEVVEERGRIVAGAAPMASVTRSTALAVTSRSANHSIC